MKETYPMQTLYLLFLLLLLLNLVLLLVVLLFHLVLLTNKAQQTSSQRQCGGFLSRGLLPWTCSTCFFFDVSVFRSFWKFRDALFLKKIRVSYLLACGGHWQHL